MAFFTAASKADFQHQLQAALAQHISEQSLPQVALFAEQFFGIISLDELTQRRLSDLAGCTLSAWRIIERFDPEYPQVRVYNPDYERNGWQSTHTVVEVLHHDLPFWSTRCVPSSTAALQHPHPADHRAQRTPRHQGRAAGTAAQGHLWRGRTP